MKLLLANKHPRTGAPLPPPIAEANAGIDVATSASQREVLEAAASSARYTAKDKANARRRTDDGFTSLTEGQRLWIERKRKDAMQRRTDKRHNDKSTKRTARDPDPDLEEQEYYDDMISCERCGSPQRLAIYLLQLWGC